MKRNRTNEVAVVSSLLAAGLVFSASAQDPGLLSALEQATQRAEAAAGQAGGAADESQDRLRRAAQQVEEVTIEIDVPEEAIAETEAAAAEAAEAAAELHTWGETAADAADTVAEEAAEVVADVADTVVDSEVAVVEPVEILEVDADEVVEVTLPPIPDLAAAAAAAEVEEPVEEVLVEVEGVAFTAAEADAEVEKRLNMFAGQVPPAQLESIRERMRAQIVDDFVNRTLIQSELEKSGITVDDAEVEEFVDQAREGLPPGFTLEEFLEQRGLSIEEMRSDVKFQLAAQKLLDERLGDQLEVSDEEVQEFFEREKDRMAQPESVHARHILISVDADASDEERDAKRAEIEGLRAELLDGASFETVAAEKSTCPSNTRGGDLGTFTRGQMVPPFEEAAFSQEIGVVGDVVETRFGFHLIEVLDRMEPTEPDLEEAREQIVEVLVNQRRAQAFQAYIQDLRAGAAVVYPTP